MYRRQKFEKITQSYKKKFSRLLIVKPQEFDTLDANSIKNMYGIVLYENYVANREIQKKGGKLYTFFADLSAAFDKVDRVKLQNIMKRKEISTRLRTRIGEIYTETRNTIKANGEMSAKFWTTKGVRQGCPLSPTLFTIYVADLEETMRKNQAGGVRIGKEKIWTLAYADDIALLANEPKDLKAGYHL